MRLGVVGVGRLGQHHARLLAALPDVELVAVADVDAARARAVAEATGARAVLDAHELLGELSAVTIATPTPSHAGLAEAFLERGVATLVEKPLAASSADAGRLVRLARERGALLAVGHSERFHPAVVAARPLMRHARFIEVHRLASFAERGTDVDVVLDLMIHDIDLVLHLLGERPARVDAVGVAVLTRLVDIANVRLGFPSGAVANLTASRVSRERVRKLRSFGRDTYVSLDTAAGRVEVVELLREGSSRRLASRVLEPEASEPLARELEAFCRAAMGEAGFEGTSGDEALAAIEVAERIGRAIRESQPAP